MQAQHEVWGWTAAAILEVTDALAPRPAHHLCLSNGVCAEVRQVERGLGGAVSTTHRIGHPQPQSLLVRTLPCKKICAHIHYVSDAHHISHTSPASGGALNAVGTECSDDVPM